MLGYWIGKPFWNLGLAREAAGEVVDLAFRMSNVERIDAQVRADNPGARAVLEDCGFRFERRGLVDMPMRGGAFVCERFHLDMTGWLAARLPPDADPIAAHVLRPTG